MLHDSAVNYFDSTDNIAINTQDKTSTMTQPIISVDSKKIPFQEHHNTLLECIESANVEVHYHCRDGYCGACRITLESGEICYPNGEPLAYVGEGEILPCCCIPKSNLTLSID